MRAPEHVALPAPGSRTDRHALCVCGRILEENPPSRSRLDGRIVAAGGWRHVSNPTSTMIPLSIRLAARP